MKKFNIKFPAVFGSTCLILFMFTIMDGWDLITLARQHMRLSILHLELEHQLNCLEVEQANMGLVACGHDFNGHAPSESQRPAYGDSEQGGLPL